MKEQNVIKTMDLRKILCLSRFVKQSSPRSIKKLVTSMDEFLIKQIIKTYLDFFLNHQNINKYLNNNNNNYSEDHHEILNLIQKKLDKKKKKKNSLKYKKNIFDKLKLLLISYLLSFCDEYSVNNASNTCHTLYYASNKSISISQIELNARKFSKNIKSQNDVIKYNKPSIYIHDICKGYEKRFGINFEK